MAISKSAKIQAEIEKVTAKINEQQARLKELEQKKLGIKVTYEQLTEMSDLLEQMKQITYPAVPEYHNAAAEIVSKLLTLTE